MTMTPATKAKLREARDHIDKKQYHKARLILKSMSSNEMAQKWLADLDANYPDTPVSKGLRSANRIIFYICAGIVGLLVIAVIFGFISMKSRGL